MPSQLSVQVDSALERVKSRQAFLGSTKLHKFAKSEEAVCGSLQENISPDDQEILDNLQVSIKYLSKSIGAGPTAYKIWLSCRTPSVTYKLTEIIWHSRKSH